MCPLFFYFINHYGIPGPFISDFRSSYQASMHYRNCIMYCTCKQQAPDQLRAVRLH